VEENCIKEISMKKRFNIIEILLIPTIAMIITVFIAKDNNLKNDVVNKTLTSNLNKYNVLNLDNEVGYSTNDLYLMLYNLTKEVTELEDGYETDDNTISNLYSQINNYSNVTSIDNAFLRIYPVGSIYISVSNTNPSTLFGGTWVSFGSGRSLVGIDTSNTNFDIVEETGGATSISYTPSGTVGNHTLTVDELPSHTHTFTGTQHRHSAPVYSTGAGEFITVTPGFDVAINGTKRSWWTNNGTADKHFLALTTTYSSSIGIGEYANTNSVTAGGTNSNTGGDASHTHTFTGTSTTLNVQDPYITVYMWKRTA